MVNIYFASLSRIIPCATILENFSSISSLSIRLLTNSLRAGADEAVTENDIFPSLSERDEVMWISLVCKLTISVIILE